MIKIFIAPLGRQLSEVEERDYLVQMPEQLSQRISRYQRWEDRQASLFGKLLLLTALGHHKEEAAASLLFRLGNTGSGKPEIKGMPSFNISHSSEIVALAVVDDGLVGIDVERIRPIDLNDFTRFLPEISDEMAGSSEDRLKAFFNCWTRKEAVLKGVGVGLLAPLDQVILSTDSARFDSQVWHLRAVDCGEEYCCHVATSLFQERCTVEIVNF